MTKPVPKPIYHDPHYHGSCDPEIVWNTHAQEWWIFYTARRATRASATYVGTPIGVAASKDLRQWRFVGYCSFDGIPGSPDMPVTFWAPGITRRGNTYHMFVTHKDNAEPPWGGSGQIVHYAAPADNLLTGWKRVSVPAFAQPDPIDATLIEVDGQFRAYHRVGKGGGIQWAVSDNLIEWTTKGRCPGDINDPNKHGHHYQEAPYVFEWQGSYWMLTDPHQGLAVYRSTDGITWTLNGHILKQPGTGPQDHTRARHPSVAVMSERALIFYHVEPNRPYPSPPAEKRTIEQKISFLQMAELELVEGQLTCDRNKTIHVEGLPNPAVSPRKEQSAPRATVRDLHGDPGLFIDDAPYPPFAYMSYLGEQTWYKEAAEAGIHLYCFPAYLGDRGINSNSGIGPFRPGIWRSEKEFDFSSIRTDFAKILSADPEAMVIIRFHLDPPRWWDQAHPEACCLLPDGTTFRQCFASPVWRNATQEALRHCVSWLLESEYAKHLIGIHVAAGGTEEWFYHFRGGFHDRNPARTEAFRHWLGETYPSDAALRQAWRDPNVTLQTAHPADISGVEHPRRWRDPSRERATLDTFRFHAQTLVDNIALFCRVVKDVSKGRLLTGAFYGYHYFVTDPRRGHGALHKLLSCPDLDYLSSPNTYYRVPGEDWPPMVAIDSVQLHGKLWMAENDTRTSITTLLKDRAPDICPPGQYASGVWLGPPDMETSVALLWKNTGRMLACGYGGWWFDMWGGWFSDPKLLDVLSKTQDLWRAHPSQIIPAMEPQVCVVVDEELCFHDASYGALTEEILSNRYPLAKTGAPYDLYLHQDLGALDLRRYRVLWLLGIPQLHRAALEQLRATRKAGITVLWTGAKGTQIQLPNRPRQHMLGKFRLSPAELRDLWRRAGVHLYGDSDDVLYAGRGWLCLHCIPGGERQIHLPFPARVTNPTTQELIASDTSTFLINLPEDSTTLLRLAPTAP